MNSPGMRSPGSPYKAGKLDSSLTATPAFLAALQPGLALALTDAAPVPKPKLRPSEAPRARRTVASSSSPSSPTFTQHSDLSGSPMSSTDAAVFPGNFAGASSPMYMEFASPSASPPHFQPPARSSGSSDAIKPPFSFPCLIGLALNTSPTGRMSVSSIYEYITNRFAYFKTAKGGWKNSVRHNLSLNRFFTKLERLEGEDGKGAMWGVAPGMQAQLNKDIAQCEAKHAQKIADAERSGRGPALPPSSPAPKPQLQRSRSNPKVLSPQQLRQLGEIQAAGLVPGLLQYMGRAPNSLADVGRRNLTQGGPRTPKLGYDQILADYNVLSESPVMLPIRESPTDMMGIHVPASYDEYVSEGLLGGLDFDLGGLIGPGGLDMSWEGVRGL